MLATMKRKQLGLTKKLHYHHFALYTYMYLISFHQMHCSYRLMLQCWEFKCDKRPSFSDIIESLSQTLQAMADYINIGAFGETPPRPAKLRTEDTKADKGHLSEKESVRSEHHEEPGSDISVVVGTETLETKV